MKRNYPITLLLVSLLVLLAPSADADHMFGPDAGWERGRTGLSIRVWAATAVNLPVNQVIASWNSLAGWELFRKVNLQRNADVKFKSSTITWVEALPSYFSPYTNVVVHVASSDYGNIHTAVHEIGHALGLADHVFAAQCCRSHVNPAVCDDPSHLRYSSYRGVMSYCSFNSETAWFGAGDLAMLRAAGY